MSGRGKDWVYEMTKKLEEQGAPKVDVRPKEGRRGLGETSTCWKNHLLIQKIGKTKGTIGALGRIARREYLRGIEKKEKSGGYSSTWTINSYQGLEGEKLGLCEKMTAKGPWSKTAGGGLGVRIYSVKKDSDV